MAKSFRSTFAFTASLLLGISVTAALLYKVGTDRWHEILSKASWSILILAPFVYALSWFFRTWRLARFTTSQTPPARTLFQIQVVGFALNAILPMKLGDAVMILGLRSAKLSLGHATAVIVQLRILDLFAVLLATAPLAFCSLQGDVPSWVQHSVSILAAVACLPPFFTWLAHGGQLTELIARRVGTINRPLLRFFMVKAVDAIRAYAAIVTHGRLFAETAILSGAIWLLEGLTTATIAAALRSAVNLSIILPAMALANLGKAAPATPGGIGIYESIMAMVLTLGGVPIDEAIIIALADHLLKKGFTLGFGLPCASGLIGPDWRNTLRMIKFKEM